MDMSSGLTGCSCDVYSELEASLLDEFLKSGKAGMVLACGGGIVETESCRDALKKAAKEVRLSRVRVFVSVCRAEMRLRKLRKRCVFLVYEYLSV